MKRYLSNLSLSEWLWNIFGEFMEMNKACNKVSGVIVEDNPAACWFVNYLDYQADFIYDAAGAFKYPD